MFGKIAQVCFVLFVIISAIWDGQRSDYLLGFGSALLIASIVAYFLHQREVKQQKWQAWIRAIVEKDRAGEDITELLSQDPTQESHAEDDGIRRPF